MTPSQERERALSGFLVNHLPLWTAGHAVWEQRRDETLQKAQAKPPTWKRAMGRNLLLVSELLTWEVEVVIPEDG